MSFLLPRPPSARDPRSATPIAGPGNFRRAAILAMPLLLLGAIPALPESIGALGTRPVEADAAAVSRIVIERQDFEDPVFPPPGWEAWDQHARGLEIPERYKWDRTTCEAPPGGGSASVWSLRGGSLGEALACLAPYTEPVDTFLTYGPIDTRGFPLGLEVEVWVKLDLPREESFRVCATTSSETEPLECYSAGVLSTDWAAFDPPIRFSLVGGQERVFVSFLHSDRDPVSGTSHWGALIDSVVIAGLDGAEPTPSPTATVDPPTATATATATASTTPVSPSATASTTPVPPSATASVTPSPTHTVETPATATSDPTPSEEPTGAATATSPPTHTAVSPTAELPTETATSPPEGSATAEATPTTDSGGGTSTGTPLPATEPPPSVGRVYLPVAFYQ